MFQATRAVKDDTRKLVGTVNRVLGGPLGEEKLDTVFERMWPELEKGLEAVPRAAAAAPLRSEREILVELLELSRASVSWSREAQVTLLKGLNRLIVLADEARVPVSGFGGLGGGAAPLRKVLLGDRTGFETLHAGGSPIAAGPEGASSEERAERARQIREIREEKEERGRMHAPSGKRAGGRGKTGDERK